MQKYSIGRDTANNIVLNENSVSRRHAELILNDNGAIFIKDLASSNGTLVNGKRISELQLQKGDMLKFGNISFNWEQYLNSHQKIPASPVNNPGKKMGLASLLNDKNEIIIGRSNDCDIVVNDSAVSRKHLRVIKFKGGYYAEDLGSTNGSYLNQHLLKSRTRINSSDILYVGLHKFSLDETEQDFTKENAIQAIKVKKEFKNGNIGLHAINLNIKAGSMVALMGPSGCGKSTLLKTLNGDNPATSGQVYIFGLELIKNYEFLKRKIGYVPQDDIVHSELTVNDTLYYAAKLSLADNALENLIEERITEVLASLNLNDPVIRHTRVKSLSGGQRKRVSIAVELLNKPSLLFLDEPTSSLDPETIEEFLKCLKNLCNEGTTVVMVTHKPEDLHFVDEIIFMGKKGYHVFAGPQEEFLHYFQKKNILEVYSLISSEKNAKAWYGKLNISDTDHQIGSSSELKKDSQISLFRQLFWLSKRYMDIKISNRKNISLIFIQPLLIAILLKLSFDHLLIDKGGSKFGDTGAIFMMAIASIWFGVSNSAKEIVGEKAIFRRERMYNLSLGNYFLSKWIVLSIISIFQLLLFLIILKISYWEEIINFIPTFGFLLLISTSSIIFGLLLSAISESTEEVMSILPIALLSQIILAGIITPLKGKVTDFLSFFTFGRWGTEGIARLQNAPGSDFMNSINANLYSPNLFHTFNSLFANVGVILTLDAVMILLVFFALNRMGRKMN